jgi:hypothetical protein
MAHYHNFAWTRYDTVFTNNMVVKPKGQHTAHCWSQPWPLLSTLISQQIPITSFRMLSSHLAAKINFRSKMEPTDMKPCTAASVLVLHVSYCPSYNFYSNYPLICKKWGISVNMAQHIPSLYLQKFIVLLSPSFLSNQVLTRMTHIL